MKEKLLIKYSEKMIEYGFYGLAFLVPLAFTTTTFELFEFPKMILVYFLTIFIVAAFLVKSIVVGKLNLKRTPLDFPILLYAVSYLLSTIFSIDRYTSIFGYYTRFNGGLLSLACYVALYYIFVWEVGPEKQEGTEGKGKKKIKFVKALLLSSLLVSIYGILQHFGIDKNYWVQDVQRRVFSTLGQPNWLAAYLVMILPVSLTLVVKNFKFQISKLLFVLLPAVIYAAFWFTYSRSGLLGFGAAMGTFLIFLGKENLKKSWQPLLLVGIVWALVSILALTPTISEKIIVAAPFYGAPVRAAQSAAATPPAQPQQSPPPTGSTVQIRLAVWKGALNLIKNHPLLGTGPETFAYSFLPYRPVELNQTAEWEFLYNKAHNEYLNIAACTGLLGLGAYLFLIGKFVWWNLKRRGQSTLRAGVFAGWVGVVISNFFGFSVVTTSLLFWLYLAFSISCYYDI